MVLGTSSEGSHALVAEMRTWGKFYLSGPLKASSCPGIMISPNCAVRRPRCGTGSRKWEFAMSSRSRRESPCIGLTEVLTKRAQASRRAAACCSIRWWA